MYVPKILSLFVMLLHYRSHFLVGVQAILLRRSGKQRGGGDDNCMMAFFISAISLLCPPDSFIPFAVAALPLCARVLCAWRHHSNVLHFNTYPNAAWFTLIFRFHSLSPESDPCPICILWFTDWQLLFGIIFFSFFVFNLNFRHKMTMTTSPMSLV